MAAIDKLIGKRGTTYRVRIHRAGMKPLTKTFKTKALADKWARQTEAEIDQKGVRDITKEAKISFGQALKDHIDAEHTECQRL